MLEGRQSSQFQLKKGVFILRRWKLKMGRKHEGEARPYGGVKPTGPLEATLKRYEAPDDVQRRIARRAGSLIGHGISLQAVERTIQNSMQMGGTGIPKWPLVEESISEAAHTVYRGWNRA